MHVGFVRKARSRRGATRVFVILFAAATARAGAVDCVPGLLFADGFESSASGFWNETGSHAHVCVEIPASSLGVVGTTFDTVDGDLDVALLEAGLVCAGGRLGDSCTWSDRSFETGEELLAVLNTSAETGFPALWRALPHSGSDTAGSPVADIASWADGPVCTSLFPADECEGRPGGQVSLLQFPKSVQPDLYAGDAFRLESPANYRWLRRELLMLVRHAFKLVAAQSPSTSALGVGDASQRDALTPGTDNGNLRHPPGVHVQGADVDLAYFNILAAQGQIPYNDTRIICDANGGSNDGAFCNPSAAGTHIVDLDRQTYFLAQLFSSPRLRVAGVDQVIAPLLRARADLLLSQGSITQAQRDAFYSRLGFGEGWQFHHHHIHVSLLFWVP